MSFKAISKPMRGSMPPMAIKNMLLARSKKLIKITNAPRESNIHSTFLFLCDQHKTLLRVRIERSVFGEING